ncbi:hypothetical protein BHE74_00052027, partial [Ensete ventricosum]
SSRGHRVGVRTIQWKITERLVGSLPKVSEACREFAKSSLKGSEACWEFIESLPRVSKACREFARSLSKEIRSFLPGWRQGVRQKKTEKLARRSSGVAEKLIRS